MDSARTVIIAFAANILVAVAKTVAAIVTGSASMLAEAAHSWADAGNEVFLLIAERKSSKPRDPQHPLGYGRESYVWSMFAAIGVFIAGAVVSVQHGVQELFHPEAATRFVIAYAVLAVSAVLETASFVQSLLQARNLSARYGRTTLDYALNGSNATLRAVMAEDGAAVIGLAIAFLGIGLHQMTGDAAYDSIGSILIGVLLGITALVLIGRNRRYLVGATPGDEARASVGRTIAARPEIERITYLHLEFVGPAQLYVVAAVDLVGDRREGELARELRNLERQIERNELIHTAVLTLSVSDEPSIEF
ncbi:MAG TPA: cation diffusion facilitator family transporter [Ilumatobacteraceae bacterium]